MEQTLEIIDIKNEPTDSTSTEQIDTSNVMQMKLIEEDSESLNKSVIYLKKEPYEGDCQFPVILSTSYDMCPTDDSKFDMYEPIIRIKTVNEKGEMMDPLTESDEIKADTNIKTEQSTEEEENERLWNINKPNLIGSMLLESNDQYQLLVVNESGRRIKKYICNDCHKMFRFKSELDKHLRIHTNKKPYECDICRKSFTQKGNLTNHVLIHSGEKTHICEVCNKVFSRKSYLNTHKMIHIGMKPFPCSMCDKAFRQKQDLQRHERTHTGEKPYSCEYCDKTFTGDSNLATHRRTHTGVKPYSCEICYKAFTQRAVLNKHKRTQHKIINTITTK